MRWRTAHKRARRRVPARFYPTWDYCKRRLGWEAMRRRLAAGSIKCPSSGYSRREIDRFRLDPAAFAELVAPQFRRFVSHPAIIIEPKLPQRFIGHGGQSRLYFADDYGGLDLDLGR